MFYIALPISSYGKISNTMLVEIAKGEKAQEKQGFRFVFFKSITSAFI